MSTTIEIETAIAETYYDEYRDVWSLIVPECPICGGRSVHGGGNTSDQSVPTKPEFGTRVSHCCGNQILLVNAGMATPEIIKPPKRRKRASRKPDTPCSQSSIEWKGRKDNV